MTVATKTEFCVRIYADYENVPDVGKPVGLTLATDTGARVDTQGTVTAKGTGKAGPWVELSFPIKITPQLKERQ